MILWAFNRNLHAYIIIKKANSTIFFKNNQQISGLINVCLFQVSLIILAKFILLLQKKEHTNKNNYFGILLGNSFGKNISVAQWFL